MGHLAHKSFDDREHNEPNKHAHIKQRPYAQDATYIKIRDMNFPGVLFFLDKKIRDEESAQYKKKVYTQVAMLKQALDVIKSIGACIPDVIEEGHVGMIQENQEE